MSRIVWWKTETMERQTESGRLMEADEGVGDRYKNRCKATLIHAYYFEDDLTPTTTCEKSNNSHNNNMNNNNND